MMRFPGKTLVSAAALLALSALPSFAADKIVLRSSDTHVADYPTIKAVEYMSQILEKETNGRLSIKVFPAAQLGEEKDTIEQTQLGVLDMNRVSMVALNNIIPMSQVPSLPFLFKSVAQMRRVLDGPIGDDILASFAEKNLIGLAFYDSGARSFYNVKQPINTPEDMKGMKIRVQQSDLMVGMVKALGANPTPMPFGEVYSALQTGAIDGAENNWPSYYTTRHFEVAKFYSETEHLMVPEALMMSKMTWDKLSKDDQKLVRDAAKKSALKMHELWEAEEKVAYDAVVKAGSKINKVDKAPFIAAMAPIYDKYVTDQKMKDMVARIRAAE
jgi:tripartite ATP-independent transporter DctP family solute receptor